jgi:hypothetical protein
MIKLTKTERKLQAKNDFRALRSASFSTIADLARDLKLGNKLIECCRKDADKIGLLHLAIKKEYGAEVYRAVRSDLLRMEGFR